MDFLKIENLHKTPSTENGGLWSILDRVIGISEGLKSFPQNSVVIKMVPSEGRGNFFTIIDVCV